MATLTLHGCAYSTGSTTVAHLDDNDLAKAAVTRHKALETLPSGQALHWESENRYTSGSVTPLRTFSNQAKQQICREYEEVLVISQQRFTRVEVSCRDPHGNWHIVDV